LLDGALGRAYRSVGSQATGTIGRMSEDAVLVTIEMRFRTTGDPRQLGDRIRESVAMIVGREELEEYRLRILPLSSPNKPRAV
jgi:hypothetical protein